MADGWVRWRKVGSGGGRLSQEAECWVRWQKVGSGSGRLCQVADGWVTGSGGMGQVVDGWVRWRREGVSCERGGQVAELGGLKKRKTWTEQCTQKMYSQYICMYKLRIHA